MTQCRVGYLVDIYDTTMQTDEMVDFWYLTAIISGVRAEREEGRVVQTLCLLGFFFSFVFHNDFFFFFEYASLDNFSVSIRVPKF